MQLSSFQLPIFLLYVVFYTCTDFAFFILKYFSKRNGTIAGVFFCIHIVIFGRCRADSVANGRWHNCATVTPLLLCIREINGPCKVSSFSDTTLRRSLRSEKCPRRTLHTPRNRDHRCKRMRVFYYYYFKRMRFGDAQPVTNPSSTAAEQKPFCSDQRRIWKPKITNGRRGFSHLGDR